jgi:hypothetical protein
MSTRLSDLALFALGLLLTPLAYVLWLRNRHRWDQDGENCKSYLRNEGGYQAVEAGIDEYLDQMIRSAGA